MMTFLILGLIYAFIALWMGIFIFDDYYYGSDLIFIIKTIFWPIALIYHIMSEIKDRK